MDGWWLFLVHFSLMTGQERGWRSTTLVYLAHDWILSHQRSEGHEMWVWQLSSSSPKPTLCVLTITYTDHSDTSKVMPHDIQGIGTARQDREWFCEWWHVFLLRLLDHVLEHEGKQVITSLTFWHLTLTHLETSQGFQTILNLTNLTNYLCRVLLQYEAI